MKCKIFISNECWDLEHQINEWLKSIEDKAYYNMKFQYEMSGGMKSVLITYRTEDEA